MTDTRKPPGGRPAGWADKDDVWRAVWTYCTSLFRVDEDSSGDPFADYIGSGTFVRHEGFPCLLTAAHVWNAMKKYRGVGFVTDVDVILLKVPIEAMTAVYVSKPRSVEWGPDFALIRLSEVNVQRLNLRKAFYDLRRDRSAALGPGGGRLCVLVGATAEGSRMTPDEAFLKNRQLASSTPRVTHHGRFSYVQVSWGAHPDAPTTWGGLSGAGLWVVDPERNNPRLAGVAFCERRSTKKRPGFIRCHQLPDIEKRLSPGFKRSPKPEAK